MVPLAMAALITPLVAAISMPISSLAVIGYSARLGRVFKDRTRQPSDQPSDQPMVRGERWK
jgi:hypothetical protein